MTDLDTLARAATRELLDHTAPDVPARYAELSRLRTRRTAAKLVAVAATVAVAAGGWHLVGAGPDHHDIRPVAPVRLELDDARAAAPEVLATLRTFQPGQNLDHDRFDGITPDGLGVRARFTFDTDLNEYGLYDLTTGETGWLPRPPGDLGDPTPLDMGEDRLVWLDNRHAPDRFTLLVFDRTTRTWLRQPFREPAADVDRFFGLFDSRLGDDGRLYLMNPAADDVQWWSIGPGETALRHDSELDGQLVAFGDAARITSDATGQVTLTRGDEDPVVLADGLPEGCDPKQDTPLPAAVAMAGDRGVAGYACRGGSVVQVFDATGQPSLTVQSDGEIGIGGTGPDDVLLMTKRRTYDLDLVRRELFDFAPGNGGGYANDADVVGDLALWGVDGPTPLKQRIFDLVYTIGRLP